ncbi:hypothetical protein BU52_28895 [Streptomyces toyocaensis]|uniref:Uncharacterized protein n=1 Tax=Streptomyces toyocaensis TaxID=55952 RepID=A0A081XJL0_STRTO|nr:hypothetical protein BU52_28895 [Streptomyces toyocaensis]
MRSVSDGPQEFDGFFVNSRLKFGGEVEQGEPLGHPSLGTVQSLGQCPLAAMDGQQTLEGAGLVEFFKVLAVDVGDEGGFEELLGGGPLFVTDHHLDGGQTRFTGCGESAAAVDHDVGSVGFDVCFAVGVGLDIGVPVHNGDRLLLTVGRQAACEVGEVSEG